MTICADLGLDGLDLPLVHSSPGVHGRTGVPTDPPGQSRVPAGVPLGSRLGGLFVSLCHLK